MGSNKLLPLVGGIVLLMLVFIGVKSCSQEDNEGILLGEVPTAPAPDADSPADTIRTLTAEVAAIKSQNKVLGQQNADLLRQRNEIASAVKKDVQDSLRLERFKQNEPILNQLAAQYDRLKARLEEVSATQYHSVSQAANDIPVGLGLDGQGFFNTQTLVWVEPLGKTTDKNNLPVNFQTHSTPTDSGSLLKTGSDDKNITESYLTDSSSQQDEDIPAFTVPRNATLIGSTGMTALIGKIPLNSTIADPFPFKVIVGRDNLTANGIDIPGLDGMIFSGKASGDWTLSCVRGAVHSVTYVFNDGTIRTLSSDDNSLQQIQKNSGGGNNSNRDLGWISDRRGIPCIAGTRISNASDYLAGRILARAIAAGSRAFAQNETTNIVSPLAGTTTSVLTGDAAKFAGLNALSGGADEISQYLAERAAQSFDVIYVDTGVEVAIHVDQELPIDYEPQGRKTSYAFNDHTATDLD